MIVGSGQWGVMVRVVEWVKMCRTEKLIMRLLQVTTLFLVDKGPLPRHLQGTRFRTHPLNCPVMDLLHKMMFITSLHHLPLK
jgi:hypothetical protein